VTPSFAALVQGFFAEHLTQQRAVSPRTVAAYRDAFVLFLAFAQRRLGKAPAAMKLTDISPELILTFLDDLEQQRHNTVRSRNARLAALRAFLKFAAHRDVSSLHVIERALGVPMKRFERPMLGFLSREAMLAVIGTPGSSWVGQRDPAAQPALQHRGTGLGDRCGAGGRRRVGRRRLRAPAWQGAQTTLRAALALNRAGNPGVAAIEPSACSWGGFAA
jgi:integrase